MKIPKLIPWIKIYCNWKGLRIIYYLLSKMSVGVIICTSRVRYIPTYNFHKYKFLTMSISESKSIPLNIANGHYIYIINRDPLHSMVRIYQQSRILTDTNDFLSFGQSGRMLCILWQYSYGYGMMRRIGCGNWIVAIRLISHSIQSLVMRMQSTHFNSADESEKSETVPRNSSPPQSPPLPSVTKQLILKRNNANRLSLYHPIFNRQRASHSPWEWAVRAPFWMILG